MCNKLDMIRVR